MTWVSGFLGIHYIALECTPVGIWGMVFMLKGTVAVWLYVIADWLWRLFGWVV